jgi:hypothetical protein
MAFCGNDACGWIYDVDKGVTETPMHFETKADVLAKGPPEVLPEPEILEPDALAHVEATTTDLALLNRAAFVATLQADAAEQTEALAMLEDFEITNADDFAFLEEILVEAKEAWKGYEARRTAFTKPANAILKEFNSWFQVQKLLKQIEGVAKGKLSAYRLAALQEQQRLVDEARAAEQPKVIQQSLVQANEIVPVPTTTQYIDRWVFEITDAGLIPREFLVPDEKKIGQVVTALGEKANIPGIRVWNQQVVRNVGRK